MLETTTPDQATLLNSKGRNSPASQKSRSSTYGYAFLFIALVAGWLLSEKNLISPELGVGYWLGIVGGSMMLLLLLYPAGKRSSLLRRLGLVKHWFRIHMILGLVGPLLILYHCNFSVDAINSTVALYSMMAVTVSGIIGRYFYTRIHRGLYGKRANIEGLREDISGAVDNNRGLAAILPNFINELHSISSKLVGDQLTRSIGIGHSLSWVIRYYWVRLRLFVLVNKELKERAAVDPVVRASSKKLRKAANAYASRQVGLMRQVAQLAVYERLFSLWHLFHMPLFLLLVVSAIVHVLAVHMY
jgi:hypothetical protein